MSDTVQCCWAKILRALDWRDNNSFSLHAKVPLVRVRTTVHLCGPLRSPRTLLLLALLLLLLLMSEHISKEIKICRDKPKSDEKNESY